MADPQQYSMTGFMPPRDQAFKIGDLLQSRFQGANPQRTETARYLQGLPLDYEGMANAYALKYGQPAATKMIEALPTMSMDDLRALQADIQGAGHEADAMSERERMAYQRAGAPTR
jgi:hypothetical protein